jgi:hypothetical protein
MISERVLITGKTYDVREQLKQLGGTWDSKQKGWSVPAEHAEQAQALVTGEPAPTRAPSVPVLHPTTDPFTGEPLEHLDEAEYEARQVLTPADHAAYLAAQARPPLEEAEE